MSNHQFNSWERNVSFNNKNRKRLLEQLDFAFNRAITEQAIFYQRFVEANLVSTMLFGVVQRLVCAF